MRFRSNFIAIGTTLSFGVALGYLLFYRASPLPASCATTQNDANVSALKCLIDGGRRVDCLRDAIDVYMPFKQFIREKFDVYGRLYDGKCARIVGKVAL